MEILYWGTQQRRQQCKWGCVGNAKWKPSADFLLDSIDQDLVTRPWPLQERLEMQVPGILVFGVRGELSQQEIKRLGMAVEWATDRIHCGLQPGILVAGFKFICSWVHIYAFNINVHFWKNICKTKDFSFQFLPSFQVYSISYLKSDDQILYMSTNYFHPLLSCSLKAVSHSELSQSFTSIWGLNTRSTKSESLGSSLAIFILNKFPRWSLNTLKFQGHWYGKC